MKNSERMEIWKEIEGSKDYYISNLGNIKHNKKNIKSAKIIILDIWELI